MFSFPRERIEHNLILGIVFGLILSKYYLLNDENKYSINKEKFLKIGLFLMSILLTFNTYLATSRFNSEFHLKKAFEARSAKYWNGVIYEIDKSESPFYQMDPFSTPVIWYRGEANFEMGNIEGAFCDYLKCFEINPYHIHVLNNLATCYELKGNHERAIELYNNAILISPKFEDALLNLTAVYFNTNRFDSAFVTINKVDSTSKNSKYIPYLQIILKKRIELINLKINEEELINLFTKIKENNQWLTTIFAKSKQNCITFDMQLLIDGLYILKDIDKTIDSNKYNELKSKYINL
jgi:tetratricopeptide (TPR) repeat protein